MINNTEQSQKLEIGSTVFLKVTEEVWDKPYVMKRHHVCDTRSVILRGIVTDTRGNEFKARLTGNNGFEKDEQEFVFNNGILLSNQDYSNFDSLGKWE